MILWVRLWGAAANALLTDDAGTILDAFFGGRRRGRSRARYSIRSRPPPPLERDLPRSGGSPFATSRVTALQREARGVLPRVETRGDVAKAAAEADSELEMSENKMLANLEKLTARLSSTRPRAIQGARRSSDEQPPRHRARANDGSRSRTISTTMPRSASS